ncbi:hypothetical protein ACFLU6_07790 [Acidobacteriota bacterium]
MNRRILKFSVLAILMLILFIVSVVPLFQGTARAEGDNDYVNFTSKKGFTHIACSSDGKYVYVVGDEGIVRSENYGRKGSWEKVLRED